MKKMIKTFAILLFVMLIPIGALGVLTVQGLPDHFNTVRGESIQLETGVPVSVEPAGEKAVAAEASARTGNTEYQTNIKMFGLIPVKSVSVKVVNEVKVVPCGTPFGLKLFTDGVVVVGFTDVDTKGGNRNPGIDAGLRIGDVVETINGVKMESNQQAAQAFEACKGTPAALTVRRGQELYEITLQPLYSESAGCYKAGLWIRDSSAGIGTMTFVIPETGVFGGLGHGVCDTDTLELLPMVSGDVVPVKLIGITKGMQGAAGELKGYFSTDVPQGNLSFNTQTGVYGTIHTLPSQREAIPVAMKQEIKKGKAQVLTTISGDEPKLYDIAIDKVNYEEGSPTKNMVIRITDPALLKQTGGIVQGMSGSPIIQNGKLIGAVTHVFVNEPEKGYAIFAENMLEEAQNVPSAASKNVA